MNFSTMPAYTQIFINGALMTLFLSVVSVLIGTVIGFMLTLGRLSKRKWLSFLVQQYLDVFRGTPLILQITILYFGLPQIGVSLPTIPGIPDSKAIIAGIIAISLNSSAYIAEIFRGGIQSMDRGQVEAAASLGMTSRQVMLKVTLPQTLRRTLPAIFNEFISLTKETAIVSVIGLRDLMFSANIIRATTYLYFEPLLIIGVIYFILSKILTRILKVLERRMQVNDQS